MRTRLISFLCLGLCGFVFDAYCQPVKAPYWLLYEQGNAFYSKKEYGAALQKYQEAIAAYAFFPEAEMAIGDVYRQESESDLAIKQYQKAYNLKNYFYIPSIKYDVLYRIAAIDQEQQLYKQMEDSLMSIINEDKSYNEPVTSKLKEQIEANYFGKGIDYVLRLYRLPNLFAADAYSQLGLFYYRSGRFRQANLLLIYAVTYKIGEAGRFLSEQDVDFQFTSLSDFLHIAEADKTVAQYLTESDVYKDLYYLAGSSFGAEYPAHSMSIWKLLSQSKLSGKYADLSRRQITAPWIEPYLQLPRTKGS